MIENSRVLGLLSGISQEWIKGLQNPQQRSLSLSYWNVVIYQIIKVLHPGWMWRKVDVCVLQLPVMCLWTFFLAAGSLHFTSWAVRYWSPVRSETSNLFADSCEHLPQHYLPLLYFSIALSDYANCLFLFCFFFCLHYFCEYLWEWAGPYEQTMCAYSAVGSHLLYITHPLQTEWVTLCYHIPHYPRAQWLW